MTGQHGAPPPGRRPVDIPGGSAGDAVAPGRAQAGHDSPPSTNPATRASPPPRYRRGRGLPHRAAQPAVARPGGDRPPLAGPQGPARRHRVPLAPAHRDPRGRGRGGHHHLPRPAPHLQQPVGHPPGPRRPLQPVHRVGMQHPGDRLPRISAEASGSWWAPRSSNSVFPVQGRSWASVAWAPADMAARRRPPQSAGVAVVAAVGRRPEKWSKQL